MLAVVLTSRDTAVNKTFCLHWLVREVNRIIIIRGMWLSFIQINALRKNKFSVRSYYKQTVKSRSLSLRKPHLSSCLKAKWSSSAEELGTACSGSLGREATSTLHDWMKPRAAGQRRKKVENVTFQTVGRWQSQQGHICCEGIWFLS